MSVWGVGGVWHTAVPVSGSRLGHGTDTKVLSFRCLSQAETQNLILHYPPTLFLFEFTYHNGYNVPFSIFTAKHRQQYKYKRHDPESHHFPLGFFPWLIVLNLPLSPSLQPLLTHSPVTSRPQQCGVNGHECLLVVRLLELLCSVCIHACTLHIDALW